MEPLLDLKENERKDFFVQKYSGAYHYVGKKHGLTKHVFDLYNNRKPNPHDLFVIEGIWALDLALKADLEIETFAFCPEFIYSIEAQEIVDAYIQRAERVYMVSKAGFERMSERNPDGLLAICKFPHKTFADFDLSKNPLLIILDGLEIPGNIGTIIRAADGAGADGIIICNRKARLTHPKLVRSSQGSSFTIPIVEAEIEEVISWLKEHEFNIYLTDTRADQEYYEADYRGRVAVIAGSERYGISEEWYDQNCKLISIPMHGSCDSLNVAIATTIVMYEASLKKKGKIVRES